MLLTYYVEVNLIAIVIAIIIIYQTLRRTSRGESSRIIFLISLWLLILMCIGDIAGLSSDGRSFPGAYVIVIVGNSIFLSAQAALAFIWLVFFQVRLKQIKSVVSALTLILSLPLTLFVSMIVINGFTGFLFTVDANNVYQRAEYIYLHWITELIYVFGSLVQLIVAIVGTRSKLQRREYISYLLYFIPTLVAGIWQISYFGASTMQVGVAISSLLVFLKMQDNELIRDELTGLNNRHALRNYENALISSEGNIQLTLFMIDLDFFKHINDTYGHVRGDEALVQIAEILKRGVNVIPGNRLVIYRYAGDEFVLAGTDMSVDLIRLTIRSIQQELDRVNSSKVNPYTLSLSVGFATGLCSNNEEFASLLRKADESMYQVKARKKKRVQAATGIAPR